MNNYCTGPKSEWEKCKRYTTKAALGFCPDFVLPDTDLTLDQIIDKYDSENEI
jgi:hypothetical protein